MNPVFQVQSADANPGVVHATSQALSFYSDISRFLFERVKTAQTLSLLDIGSRIGLGPAFLRAMYHPQSYASLKLDPVSAIDIDPAFEPSARVDYPDIEAITGDAFKLPSGRTWDIVMSSHMIEHTDDPATVLENMKKIANRMAVIACPYHEEDLIQWHSSRITYKMLSAAGFHDMQVYRSPSWFNSLCVIAAWHRG